MKIETFPELNFLSELYAADCPSACLLAEYPSSNSPATPFKNRNNFIIHDPFPPPHPELMKVLGPHHLMCGWGNALPVASRVSPPDLVLQHWNRLFTAAGCEGAALRWQPATTSPPLEQPYITLFPHESIPAASQVIDPAENYRLHSKEIIAEIDCPQANVLNEIQPPCMVKLSHGYAGLGNFLLHSADDQQQMQQQLDLHWPDATLVTTAVIENIVGDFGAQFYLRRDGSMVWLGLTEQKFDAGGRWSGGVYSAQQQSSMFEPFSPFLIATGHRLHQSGYHGLVGIDILQTAADEFFLVDVNPRLTGITPFLMAARIFQRQRGLTDGIYRASCRFSGTMEQLIEAAENVADCTVMVLSAFEEVSQSGTTSTICHLSASGKSLGSCERAFDKLIF